MIDTAPKPKRRWRLPTLAVLLLFVGLVAWRTLSGSDSRFIGKWQVVKLSGTS
jgi:hypothetical protein